MIRKILEIKAWRGFVDLNMQSYLFTILFCLAIMGCASPAEDVLILIVLLSLYLFWGILFNDYCDRPFDIRAGKKRAIHEIPKSVTLGILATFILVSFFLIVLLLLRGSEYEVFIPAYAAAWLLSICYSAFPMRLKERGVWGIIDDVLIEKTLPVFLIFAFFNCYSLETLIIVLLFSFLQLEIILDHQCWDYDSDIKSGITTFAVKMGIEKVTAILDVARKLFLALFFIFAILLAMRFPYSLIVLIPLLFGYFIVRKLVSEEKLERKNIIGYVNISKEWIAKAPLYDGYIVTAMNVIALFMAFFLSIKNYYYSFLLSLVILSQYYIIRVHYMRILKIIFVKNYFCKEIEK